MKKPAYSLEAMRFAAVPLQNEDFRDFLKYLQQKNGIAGSRRESAHPRFEDNTLIDPPPLCWLLSLHMRRQTAKYRQSMVYLTDLTAATVQEWFEP
ncbi:Hypothetical predicted protein [Octopus vulgaris]|uniref:Uncharacterized protein n=1 Tax=Octopus vulgaris TaxID=6645 RepID=A0AA36B6C6_OCTVU|nr:Hypothetical predicted protein [Octopus vulgaris]